MRILEFNRERASPLTRQLCNGRLRDRLARMGTHEARSLFTWTGIAHQLVAAVEQRATVSVTLDDKDWDEPWKDGD